MYLKEALDDLYVCATNAKNATLEEGYYEKCYDRIIEEIEKQDTEINSLKETIQKQEKSREHLKKQLKGEIAVKDTEINKLNNAIDRMAEYIYSKTDFTVCGNIKFIKEYFMKEDK